VQVSVGRDHLAAVTTDGKLLTMGSEDHGKLGHKIKVLTAEEIKNEALRYKKHGQVPGIAVNKGAVGFVNGDWSSPIVQVSCGNSHTVALT